MTSKVLGIDLHDAGRDGVYRIVPDDPATLIGDAERAGLHLLRMDLADLPDTADLTRQLATTFEFPVGLAHDWEALANHLRDLRWLPAPGYVLLLDHAHVLRAAAGETFSSLCKLLTGVARSWHDRGVPFFVFLEFPDNETFDAAIDA